jgi:preprotein translocase subunit SecG
MATVLLIIHLMIALALVIVILMQRSEGGALSGLGGGGAANFMTARGTGNALTQATATLATLFFITSIALSIISKPEKKQESLLAKPISVEGNMAVPTVPQKDAGAPIAVD